MLEPLHQDAPGWERLALKTMTLPPATTTNALLIGEDTFIIVDPGAISGKEQARLHHAVDARLDSGDSLAGVFLTHHHPDHVGGVDALLSHLSGRGLPNIPVMAHPETFSRVSLPDATPEHQLSDELNLKLGGLTLKALFTPGHAPGHMALWEPARGILAAGDMVASEGTIIVTPPSGDMSHYLASLRRLRELNHLKRIIPAHGTPIDAPLPLLDHYISHRLMRETRVLKALTASPQTALELVPTVYPELSSALYPLASQSLLAHLLKLESEGHAVSDQTHRWRVA